MLDWVLNSTKLCRGRGAQTELDLMASFNKYRNVHTRLIGSKKAIDLKKVKKNNNLHLSCATKRSV